MPKGPGRPMDTPAASSAENSFFLALKGLAIVAELAMLAGVIYAAATAARYWSVIGV